jgi:hypothetical protein
LGSTPKLFHRQWLIVAIPKNQLIFSSNLLLFDNTGTTLISNSITIPQFSHIFAFAENDEQVTINGVMKKKKR